MAHVAARVRAAQRYARVHGLKTGPIIQVPKLETFREVKIRPVSPTLHRRKMSVVERKTKARARRKEKAVKGESGLNLRVTGPLSRRFPGRVGLILEQAVAAYHYRNPQAETSPEPYELSEGGFIDEALESLGLPHVPTIGS